ncbi:hypothetical protein B0H65DRAFT_74703 [Neurospora tetraspora]|uniref:Uncharacterized protein n=1 Tax=Neurospora tetraspora TaxID=94610 RepID=A0AAE0MJ83_9PEZI|nr:hypothetical protein B0H65DRAFT_74703 [Neurospora tetraspora]
MVVRRSWPFSGNRTQPVVQLELSPLFTAAILSSSMIMFCSVAAKLCVHDPIPSHTGGEPSGDACISHHHYYIIGSRFMDSADMQCRMQSEAVVTVINNVLQYKAEWTLSPTSLWLSFSSPLEDWSNYSIPRVNNQQRYHLAPCHYVHYARYGYETEGGNE